MLRLSLGMADLAATRFAVSPIGETVRSLRTLHAPGRHAVNLPWYRWAATELQKSRLDINELWELIIGPGDRLSYPGFVTPAPDSRLRGIDAELAELRGTPLEYLRGSVRRVFDDDDRPQIAADLLRRPRTTVRLLADQIGDTYRRLIEPHWERIEALLDADILYRAATLSRVGVARTIIDLHPRIHWDGTDLVIEDNPDWPRATVDVELGAGGLVLVPSVFAWPDIVTKVTTATHTVVRYPARGVGAMWESALWAAAAAGGPPLALARLIGGSKAELLSALRAPSTTTELAGRLGVTAGAVSQQLRILRDAGLVTGTRDRREVLYIASPLGLALVNGQR